jgi:hypothetical protein
MDEPLTVPVWWKFAEPRSKLTSFPSMPPLSTEPEPVAAENEPKGALQLSIPPPPYVPVKVVVL